jgi:aldehyde:ferredoxin oxidoreductase
MANKYPKGGYQQRILRVDLSRKKILHEALPADMLRKYVGGTGLGIRFLYDELRPGIDPYSSRNRLIFVTGPLTGTMVPGSGTYTVISKNTLTGLIASAQSNGFLGARLKYAGYDAIIIQGRSPEPVYLHINDEEAEIQDASQLIGRDTFETESFLRKKYGEAGIENRISVAAIGPAGENLVRFACIVSDGGHVASTGGLGAIMGSKNLKAIVVHGNRGVPIAPENKTAFVQCVKEWIEEAKQTPMGKSISQKGTIGLFMPYHTKGWVPVKNLTTNIFPGDEKFEAEYIREKLYRMQPRSCHCCTFAHCHMAEITKGPYKGFVGEEPEYEILAGFGPNWGIYDPAAVTVLNTLNDRLGMDAKEGSFLISMFMEGYEKGLIGKKDLDGIELKWGDVGAAQELMKKISKREGVGDLLSEGVMRAAHRLGKEFEEIAVFVKKGNAPHIHDPRTRWGTLFTQAISNTGTQEGVDMSARAAPELGLERPASEPDEYLAEVQAKTGPKRQFEECLCFCYFQSCAFDTMIKTVNTLTGADYDRGECLKIGRRVVNLLRLFNNREGMTKDDDSFSTRLGQSPVDGPGAGKSLQPNYERIRDAYYRKMGWNRKGVPTRKTLNELGL